MCRFDTVLSISVCVRRACDVELSGETLPNNTTDEAAPRRGAVLIGSVSTFRFLLLDGLHHIWCWSQHRLPWSARLFVSVCLSKFIRRGAVCLNWFELWSSAWGGKRHTKESQPRETWMTCKKALLLPDRQTYWNGTVIYIMQTEKFRLIADAETQTFNLLSKRGSRLCVLYNILPW